MSGARFARFWAILALAMCLGTGVQAQTVPAQQTAAVEAPLDFNVWEKLATTADALIDDPTTESAELERTRQEIAGWRTRLLSAQGINASRIATIRAQIEALGAPPAEGTTEPADIALRRKELLDQLAVAQAPAIAAVEAYSRADGVITEIDRALRERQAEALLQVWPLPINPANWPDAAETVMRQVAVINGEVRENLANDAKRDAMVAALPLIIGLLLFAALMIVRGRALIESKAVRLMERGTTDTREIWSFVASLGQVVVPILGVLALTVAMSITELPGPLGQEVITALFVAGATIFVARWLGSCSFPHAATAPTHLRLDDTGRAKGRFLVQWLGIILALDLLREAVLLDSTITDAAQSVLAYPTLLVSGFLLFKLAKLLLHSTHQPVSDEAAVPFSSRLIGLIARVAVVVAVLGPLLATAGYVRAGQGIVFPMIASLGLVAFLLTLQNLVGAVYAVLIRDDTRGRDALVPVLVGFFLAFAATPFLALIWGARVADITEVFTKLRDGFQIGQTRISPSDFILLAVVFGFWFLITRLLQGALKTSILPKTSLDQGGQNAIVSAVGYVGIFLAALIGITSAGIDLSGLAIVAGALSVGLGFGLQNIVSNFVAGIILLIERPISEGDWIEVNGTMGTVRSISVRSTRIQTFDRTDVIVPNSDFISGMVTNWTRFNLSGRLIVKVGVAYGTDTRKVEKILQEIAEAQPLAVLNPPPAVLLAAFGADSLDFEIRLILRDVNFSVAVKSEINHEIARRFAEEGIEIPFGQRDIWIRNPEAFAQMSKPVAATVPDAAPDAVPDAPKPA
jgi:potassium efflux system protein